MRPKTLPKDFEYRVITWKQGKQRLFGITEIFFKKGKAITYTEDTVPLNVLNMNELKWTVKSIKKCLRKPIINIDKFPKEYKLI